MTANNRKESSMSASYVKGEIINFTKVTWKGYKFELGKPHPFAFYEQDGNVKNINITDGIITIEFEGGYTFKIDKDGERISEPSQPEKTTDKVITLTLSELLNITTFSRLQEQAIRLLFNSKTK